MQSIRNDMIQVGDYVKFRRGGQRFLQVAWWKATRIEDGTVHLIDRTGATARVSQSRRFHEQHALRWEPGDDRNDEV